MAAKADNYLDVEEGRPRVTSYDDHGVRTTKTITKLGVDPNEKPKETVTVQTIEHPDATETVTITEKKLPPMRYTETVKREKMPKAVSTTRIIANEPAVDSTRITTIPPYTTETYFPDDIPPPAKTYNVVRRERIIEQPNNSSIPITTKQDRVIVKQPERMITPRVVMRSTPEPSSYVQVQNPRTTRIVDVRQASSPVIVDVTTPPLTKTRVIDNTRETIIDDRRTLVNYQDDYYATRRTGRRTDWCGNCGADCCGCGCWEDCCSCGCFEDCCRTNSFAQRKDVVSYGTRITKDGRRVRYRNADVPGYRCCNCCTGWCARVCPCCACLESFCACPCWLWLCCLLPLLLGLLGLSIGLLTQLPSITSNTNSVKTLRVIEQVVNETWYVYGLDQPCQGSATTFPPSLSTLTTLIPCAQTTTSWARIIQATTLVTITINSSSNRYNELRVTQSYNTVYAVLGQNAVCQPDRNQPGIPLYCDQTTTRLSVTATSSSSTVYAIQVNKSDHLDYNHIVLVILTVLSFCIHRHLINDHSSAKLNLKFLNKYFEVDALDEILQQRRNEFKTRAEQLQKRQEALREREIIFKERIVSYEMYIKELAMKRDRSSKRLIDEKNLIENKQLEINSLQHDIEQIQEENRRFQDVILRYQPHMNFLTQIVDQTDRFQSIDEMIEKFEILRASYQDTLMTIQSSNEELNEAQRKLSSTIEQKNHKVSFLNNRLRILEHELIKIQQQTNKVQTEISNQRRFSMENLKENGTIKIALESMFELAKKYSHRCRRKDFDFDQHSSTDNKSFLMKLKQIDDFLGDLIYYVDYVNNQQEKTMSNRRSLQDSKLEVKLNLNPITESTQENHQWRGPCEIDRKEKPIKTIDINPQQSCLTYKVRGEDNALYTIRTIVSNNPNISQPRHSSSSASSILTNAGHRRSSSTFQRSTSILRDSTDRQARLSNMGSIRTSFKLANHVSKSEKIPFSELESIDHS